MPMPKATVDKENRAPLGKHQIGSTWKISAMQTESKPCRVETPPHE